MPTPTPIYSLPLFTIEQMRAVAGVLRGYIDGNAPDTNEGADWKAEAADYAAICAAACHLDVAIKAHGKPEPCKRCAGSGVFDTGCGEVVACPSPSCR